MSWGEVFKINSNMSQPLDKLIKSQRTYVASDYPLYLLSSDLSGNKSSGTVTVKSFTPTVNGSLRLSATQDSQGAYGGYFAIYKDTTQINYIDFSSSEHVTKTADFEIVQGSTYVIKVSFSQSSYTSFKNVYLLGSLVDTSMLGISNS